jgi:hypothetical protein
MDRIRFVGVFNLCIKCRIKLPHIRTVRIRLGHVRADCAPLSDAQLNTVIHWARQHESSDETGRHKFISEMLAVLDRRFVCADKMAELARSDEEFAEFQSSLEAVNTFAIPA